MAPQTHHFGYGKTKPHADIFSEVQVSDTHGETHVFMNEHMNECMYVCMSE